MLPKTKHPLFEVEVPSTKKKVKMRPLLVKEEKILLMAKESKDDTLILNSIKQVVQNCLSDKIDVEDMTIYDLEFLFLRLRASSVSNIATIMIIDKEDRTRRDVPVDLFDVKIKEPENPVSNTVKFNDITIVLRYPRVSLYEKISSMDETNMGQVLIAHCIDKIFDGDQVFNPRNEKDDELFDFIDNLPVPVYKQIEDYVSNPPVLYYQIQYKNANGEDRLHELKTLDDFFILR